MISTVSIFTRKKEKKRTTDWNLGNQSSTLINTPPPPPPPPPPIIGYPSIFRILLTSPILQTSRYLSLSLIVSKYIM